MNNQEKRRVFEEHLKEQERQREVNQERKKQAESLKNSQEDMLFIQKEFRSLAQEMDRLTAELKKGNGALPDLFAHYAHMKNYYVEINYVLTTYDRQYYKELLERTHATLLELKKKLEPKKKFKFSRRDEDFGVKEKESVQEFKAVESQQQQIAGLDGRKGETITITTECPTGGSYRIVNCADSTVVLLEKTEILFLKNLTNCRISCAVTKSTVFVDQCSGCTFDLNCHQLRIHNTTDTRFNIFVTSKAIIEDCKRVQFAPYALQYPDRARHEQEEDREGKPNLWRDIQDFNWLKENEKSPHYELLEN